jgi:hypothetical protein
MKPGIPGFFVLNDAIAAYSCNMIVVVLIKY